MVTTAGDAEALMEATKFELARVYSFKVRARLTNTGLIYIGNSTVDDTTGDILSPGESIWYETIEFGLDRYLNLTQIFIDADISGEGISFTALREF